MDWWIVKQLRAMILTELRDFIPPGYFESESDKFHLDDRIANSDHFSRELRWGYLAGDLGRRLFFESTALMSARQVSASEVLMNLGMLAGAEAAQGAATQLSKDAEARGVSDGNAGAVAEQLGDQQIPTLSNNVRGALKQYLRYLTQLESEPFLPLLPSVLEPPLAPIQLFLSTVSAEFRNYRDSLRHDLDRPNVTVKVQEDFIATGTETLDKLDEYVRQCNAVVHLVGDMTGALAQPPSVAVIRQRYPDFAARLPVLKPFLELSGPALPYTQWEAWLAMYHGKVLIIAIPEDDAPRDEHYLLIAEQRVAQRDHLARLAAVERYPEIRFANADRLAVDLLRSKLQDILTPHQTTITLGNIKTGKPELMQLHKLATLERVRAMALSLLDTARMNWKMPRFVAPLSLEAQEEHPDRQSRPTSIAALIDDVDAGENLVLFGEGGIGKTTFLLELSSAVFAATRRRIPIYIEAASWARTNTEVLDYIASRPASQRHGMTVSELAGLADTGCLTLAINGWNEIPITQKLGCLERLSQLTTTMPELNIVMVTRTVKDAIKLRATKHVQVRGLTWQGQSKVIRAELDEASSSALIELLARDTRLRYAARSPLILKGLLARAKKGEVASSSAFDLLGTVVDSFEEDDQRGLVLSIAPVDGHQRAYLEELACLLTQRLATNCSRVEALQAIHSAATRLAERQLIGLPPSPTAVLEVLVNHHLLHLDEGVVRFAHQRFQEYFAANRLLRECVGDDVQQRLLRSAVNHPAWDEALALVAGKLNGEGGSAAARVRMIKVAAGIDLGLACDLAGRCGLSDTDDSELCNYIVTCANELASSPVEDVRDLGVAYQIASRFPAFAEKLWPLLESENLQTRLHTFRLNGSAISLSQLGSKAEQRIASWPSGRRVEFVHEMGDNADNYDFLVGLARREPDPAVQAAAICALFWYFPASDVPLQAWLDAPIGVQTQHNVLSYIQYALGEGHAGDEVRERLQTIAVTNMSDNGQLQLALAFPNEVGPRALGLIFKHLRSIERHGANAPLIAIARTNSPERLMELARELALEARVVPDWVGEYLLQAPVDVRTEVFERGWRTLQGPDFKNVGNEVLGPLANHSQTERSVASWLEYAEANRGTLTNSDHERNGQLGYLLAHAPGGELLNVVMQRGHAASYNEAAHLVELVLRRIGRDDGSASTANQWEPTVEEVRQLVALFADKVETAEVPQDAIRVYLCFVASHVAPAQFGSLLLETCRRHLNAWSTFQEKVNQWSKSATSPRPNNPSLGLYLASALVKWGPDALPGLLELMGHPSAMEFIPETIARIVSLPWASKREGLFSSVSTDIQEGEQRRRLGRELRQPDDAFQHWTDDAAKVLGQRLSEMVAAYQEKKATDENWNAREAEYRVGRLAGVVANIPSAGTVEPAYSALASGLINVYGAVGVLRGLVRQGLCISDTAVVGQLEALYEQATDTNWHDHSARYAMSAFSELLFCVVPTALLEKPIGHYLKQWCLFSHPNEVLRHLVALHSETAWPTLLELGRDLAEKGPPPEELTPALVSALTPRNFAEFLALVESGTLFAWCNSEWSLKRLAPNIAIAVSKEPGLIEDFLDVCRRAQSSLADALAGEVLSHIKGSEEVRQAFLLETLDAGRAVHPNMPAYRMLRDMFTLEVPISGTQYEVAPMASNELRRQLYARARGAGPIADGCKRLLASLECGRREAGRPDDEPRHPDQEDGLAWTDALLSP